MAHLTRKEVLESGHVSTVYRAAFEARPIEVNGSDLNEIRVARAEQMLKLRHLYPIPGAIPELVTETLHNVPTRDGASIRVKVYQPVAGPREGQGSPLIIMFHEGAWMLGELEDEDLNCRLFARDLGAVCVNVEYRLAPEHPFPQGVNDCYDALLWAVSHAESLKADPRSGLIVGGSSAGGNFAAVLALLSRDTKLDPPITGQFLCFPVIISEANVPPHLAHLYESRRNNIYDPVMAVGGQWPDVVEAIYAPDTKSPLWDPFNNPAGHSGVAKAFFQVGGIDPLRDEAVLYDRKLRADGVLTRFELYPGYGHMFRAHYPELEESAKFSNNTVKGVRWLLEK